MLSSFPISRFARQSSSFLSSLSSLPLDSIAKSTRAISHFTTLFPSASVLLQLLYVYTFISKSLSSTSIFCSRFGIGNFSDDILRYRFRLASDFLCELISKIIINEKPPLNLIMRDATYIAMSCPGRVEFIAHSEYDISSSFFKIKLTTNKISEGFDRFDIPKGSVLCGDALFGVVKEIKKAEKSGAYCMVRTYLPNLILHGFDGKKVKTIEVLKKIKRKNELYFTIKDENKYFKIRLLIIKIDKKKSEIEKRRKRKISKSNGRTPSSLSMKLCDYIIIATTIPAEIATYEKCCSMYRLRWQIELFFKRCKSICGLGELKKCSEELAKTTILMKILMIAITTKNQTKIKEALKNSNTDMNKVSDWKLFQASFIEITSLSISCLVNSEGWEILSQKALDGFCIGKRKRVLQKEKYRTILESEVCAP